MTTDEFIFCLMQLLGIRSGMRFQNISDPINTLLTFAKLTMDYLKENIDATHK